MVDKYDMFYEFEDDEDLDYEDENFDPEVAESFIKDISVVLYDIINTSGNLSENFISPKCREEHYRKHCLGRGSDKRSRKTNVYYDFTDKSQYIEYERKVSDKIKNTHYDVTTLSDYELIIGYLRKLFYGGIAIKFCNSCGLHNSFGLVNLSLISFSSDVTKNYRNGNTIDICIKSMKDKTITLYPVDAHYLQTKFNHILVQYGQYAGPEFDYNYD